MMARGGGRRLCRDVRRDPGDNAQRNSFEATSSAKKIYQNNCGSLPVCSSLCGLTRAHTHNKHNRSQKKRWRRWR